MKYIKRFWFKVKCAVKHINCAQSILHSLYFGLVAYEAHHFYGIVATGLLVITLIEIGGGQDEV